MDELMDKYKDKFGECFPLMLVMGMSEEDITKAIKQCLQDNKPYEVDSEQDY